MLALHIILMNPTQPEIGSIIIPFFVDDNIEAERSEASCPRPCGC